MTPPIIEAQDLAKSYGANQALRPATFTIPTGQVVGVIGANGAGKTTLINAILGLHDYDGSLRVLGRDPYKARAALMEDVSFISDVASLPRWMTVAELLRYVEDVHPRFDRTQAQTRLDSHTKVRPTMRIRTLSKGMMVQLHLCLVLAIDAKLLVLDEPTLGLDVLHRRSFYDALIGEFFDNQRSILITTHQIDEIDQILTHALFLKEGEIIVNDALEALSARFLMVEASPAQDDAAQALSPVASRKGLGRNTYVYDGQERGALEALGEVRRASLTEMFIALAQDDAGGQP